MSKSAEEIEPFSISDDDMTIVHKKDKNESKQQLLKKAVVMTVFITIALVVLFEIFGGGQDSRGNMTSPQSPQIRSPSVSDEKEGEIPEEGRLFIFNLANLKEGATGEITIRTRPSWAPKGVEQFESLVDSGFFDGCRFFRVVKNFIVQFGINVRSSTCFYPTYYYGA
jgi:Cyclophilin type peptidyl-prolyl cis-trans isomerase/CLD